MNNLPPFYVGQKVVALKTSEKRLGLQIIKGNIYTVAGFHFCSCGNVVVTLKELVWPRDAKVRMCHDDNYKLPYAGGKAKNFAPLTENFESISYEKVMETESKLIGVN